ncbi:MAG: Clp protease N-terminal domain-containing protein, partial [Candidatus Promineifilaceae bacterium]
MRFDRFTERAQDAAARAYEIVQRYGHTQVDTEHLLLAILEQEDGAVNQILGELSVDVLEMKDRLDEDLRASPKVSVYGGGVGQIFYTPRIRTVLELAQREANALKDEFISTEHIFLAILGERNTPSARILQEFGATRDRVMSAIQSLRGGQKVTDRQAESREVYFIVSGKVRVVNYSMSGREVTFDDLIAGSHFGELAALDSQPRSANVVAIEPTTVASLTHETFRELLQEHPEVAARILVHMAQIIRASTERIMDLSTLGANNRVYAELLRLSKPGIRDDRLKSGDLLTEE